MNYPQPGYQPQFPQVPQQQFPQQGYPAAPPAPQYAQPYPPQQYAAPQPAPQGPPPAAGTLDAFYNQPSTSTGPSLSFKDKPIGFSYVGIVARDVTNADVQQMTDFTTKAPLFYRDGRPKFAMKVPLRVQPSQEFPEGEASWYVKGQARDELVRAMAEAGASGAPQGGATIVITLVGKRPSGAGMNPANVFQVQYHPAGADVAAAVQPQQQQPVQQAPQQIAQPQAAPVQQYQQPVPQQQFQQPVPQQAPAPVAQPVQQGVPQAAPQPPSDLSPEQQALLAKLTGQNQPAA